MPVFRLHMVKCSLSSGRTKYKTNLVKQKVVASAEQGSPSTMSYPNKQLIGYMKTIWLCFN